MSNYTLNNLNEKSFMNCSNVKINEHKNVKIKNTQNIFAKIWVDKRLNCLKVTNEQNILQY